MVGQGIGQVDPAHVRQLVAGEMVEERSRAGAAHQMLGEGGGVDDADGVADGFGLGLGILPPGTPAESAGVVVEIGGGILGPIVVRAFPAVHLAELRAHLLLAVIGGGGAQGAAGFAFLVRVVQDEDVVVAFLVLAGGVFGGHPAAEALGVEGGHVDLGLALGHQLGKVVAGAARCGDAEGEALRQPHVAQAGGRADQRVAVGGVADRAVVVVLEAHGLGRGNPVDEGHVFLLDPFEVEGEEVGAEAVGDAVLEAGRGALLIGAEDPAAAFLAHIPLGVRVAQDRVLRVGLAPFDQRGVGLGHDILVFDHDGGGLDAEEFCRALGVVAGGGDDMLGGDVEAVVGGDEVAAAFFKPGAGDDPFAAGPAVAVDLDLALDGRAQLPRALGHRLRHVGRVDVAVLRVVERADQVFGADERPAVLDLVRFQEFVVDPGGFRDRGIQHVFVHPLLVLRHPQVADNVEARVQARLRLQPLVEIDRVFVDVGRRVRHVEERQQAGCMPGGARSQLVALDQHGVPARFRQMVGDAGADCAAADDEGFHMGFHLQTLPECVCLYLTEAREGGQVYPTFGVRKRHSRHAAAVLPGFCA